MGNSKMQANGTGNYRADCVSSAMELHCSVLVVLMLLPSSQEKVTFILSIDIDLYYIDG